MGRYFGRSQNGSSSIVEGDQPRVSTGEAHTAAAIAALARIFGARNAPQEFSRYLGGLDSYRRKNEPDFEDFDDFEEAPEDEFFSMSSGEGEGGDDSFSFELDEEEDGSPASQLGRLNQLGLPQELHDLFAGPIRDKQESQSRNSVGNMTTWQGTFAPQKSGSILGENQDAARDIDQSFVRQLEQISGSMAQVPEKSAAQQPKKKTEKEVKGGLLTKVEIKWFDADDSKQLKSVYDLAYAAEKSKKGSDRVQASKVVQARIDRLREVQAGFGDDLQKRQDVEQVIQSLKGWKNELVQFGGDVLGTPYSWGGGGARGAYKGIGRGSNTVGFDCSGFTEYVAYKEWGVKIPGTCVTQFNSLEKVDMKHVREGDFLYWSKGKSWHTGVLVYKNGEAYLRNAPQTGDVVRDIKLSTFMKGTKKTFRGARRASGYGKS